MSSSACWARASPRPSSWRSAGRPWTRSCGWRGEVARRSDRYLTGDPGRRADRQNDILDALNALSQQLHQAVLVPVAGGPSISTRIQDFFAQWATVLTVVFMAAIVYVLWRTLKVMPKTKPVQIKPQANLEVGWDDIAGVDEAKYELQEVVEFLRDEKRFKRLGAKVPEGRPAARARRAPARRCWPRPSPRSPARSSSRSRRPRSSRCSPASARRASGACSTRRASTRPRSSSSTSSTPSAAAAARTSRASASRRSTSCSSRWTASPAPTGSS